jgi:hypothetical protein
VCINCKYGLFKILKQKCKIKDEGSCQHEGGGVALDAVAGADPGEDRVGNPELRKVGRNETSELSHRL